MPEVFRENGYSTAMFSAHKAITADCPLGKAFDHAELVDQAQPAGFRTFEDINRALLPYLDKTTRSDKPFFLYIHAVDTHFPHLLSSPYDKWIDPDYDTARLEFRSGGQHPARKDGRPFTAEDKEHLRALHQGSIYYSDTHFGRLVDKLAELGIIDNTVFIINSDHGDALGEDGHTVAHAQAGSSDQVLRVPLIMAGPGIPRGLSVGRLVENVDIFPTLVDLLGFDCNGRHDGESLLPVLYGQGREVHRRVFAWLGGGQYERPNSMSVRDNRFNYELDLNSGLEHLWRMPDDLANRADVREKHPDVTRDMRNILFRDYWPLWESYRKSPFSKVVLKAGFLREICREPENILWKPYLETETDGLLHDNRWSFSRSWLTSGPDEDAPPVVVRFEVPQGKYAVRGALLSTVDYESSGKPASSVSVKLENDPHFTDHVTDGGPAGNPEVAYVDLGVYDIDDGAFEAVLDDIAGDDRWTCFVDFNLIPCETEQHLEQDTSESGLTAEQIEEKQAVLEAMGYLD